MNGSPLCVGIFCDCQNRGGVFTYTCRLGRELRRRGVRVEVFTCRPQTRAAEAILEELRTAGDVRVLDGPQTTSAVIANLARALRRQTVTVFVPNYRGLSYAAAANVSRHRNLKVVGVCHSDDASSYALLRH